MASCIREALKQSYLLVTLRIILETTVPQGMAPGEEPCVLDVLVHSSEFVEPIIRFTYEEIEARNNLRPGRNWTGFCGSNCFLF